jgi:hypothetical protein
MASPRPPAAGALPDLYVEPESDRVVDLRENRPHRPEAVESGSFTRARCTTCGWTGPARRARAVALADVEQHQLLG